VCCVFQPLVKLFIETNRTTTSVLSEGIFTYDLAILKRTELKGYSTFLEIGSFYNSFKVKQLSFTIFESIQPIF